MQQWALNSNAKLWWARGVTQVYTLQPSSARLHRPPQTAPWHMASPCHA
jgi:hypothetical protein